MCSKMSVVQSSVLLSLSNQRLWWLLNCLFILLFRRKLSGVKYGGEGGENGGNKTSSLDTGIYNKEEEEERLKALMRDDFIDDLKSGDCVPVQLPMVDTGKIS